MRSSAKREKIESLESTPSRGLGFIAPGGQGVIPSIGRETANRANPGAPPQVAAAAESLLHPIVLVNTRNYFAPLVATLEHMVAEQFMGPHHNEMWQIVDAPEDVPRAFETAPPWSAAAREFAQLK